MLKETVDPTAGGLRAAPHDERDLMIAASNSWLMSFDNLSGLPHWLSDALCRISTGGALSCRQLYSDREETVLEAQRPVLANGIDAIASRHDLVDRAIVISLPTLQDHLRRPETELWTDFRVAHPHILAGLLDAVVAALSNRGKVSLPSLPRMADFCLWVVGAEETLLWEPGAFMVAYEGNRAHAVGASLDADLVASAIQQLMDARDAKDAWEGTASELLEDLTKVTSERTVKSRAWPTTPHVLSGRLVRAATFLRQAGVEVEQFRGPSPERRRRIRIKRKIRVQSVHPEGEGLDAMDAMDEVSGRYSGTAVQPDLWDGPAEVEI
jgi:hypothetical protein